MINLLIDTYKLNNINSGLGQFSLNFANNLISKKSPDYKINLLAPRTLPENILNGFSDVNIETTGFTKRYFPEISNTFNIWHSLYQFPSFLPNRKNKWILTIHDLNFLIEKPPGVAKRYLQKMQTHIDRADCITTVSVFSKNQIEKYFSLGGKKVYVIYNGVAFPDIQDQKFRGNLLKEKYFFTIGIFNRKKSFHRLLPAVKHFIDHKLVIAGNNNTEYGTFIKSEIKRLKLSDRIILPGEISDSEKQWFYSNCEAFLFPSIAEGFGIPVIEAMHYGKPVFLSKETSLPEIGGECGYYFENQETDCMISTISDGIQDFENNKSEKALQLKEHALNFTWDKCIVEYIKLYNQL